MKKGIIFLIVGALLINGLGAAAFSPTFQPDTPTAETTTYQLSSVELTETSTFTQVTFKETDTYLSETGKPLLPKIVHTFELPFDATNIEVLVTPKDFYTTEVSQYVQPSAALLPLTTEEAPLAVAEYMDKELYQSNSPYPSSIFDYSFGCGINEYNEHVTFVSVHAYPVQYTPKTGVLTIAETMDIAVDYETNGQSMFPATSTFDMVIIAPEAFADALQPLIEHKNGIGIETMLKTTEEIYAEFDGVDKPEQIKYFIKDALEEWGITYVLLVGGLNSVVYAKPRDGPNFGATDWYLPVRYTNLWDNPKFPLSDTLHDPGVICDLYYADIYEQGGSFSSWDPSGDGIFAAWGNPNYEDDVGLDFYPDVALGRLACRSVDEVNTLVDKIITYESSPADDSWFKKMIVVSGDGFLDQTDLNILWDTNDLPAGEYTIYAQSFNPEDETGPVEMITVTVDHSQNTVLTFNHDDHLRTSGYPGVPIAEICTVSEGNILGSDDFEYTPGEGEAYCNEFYHWANMSYVDGVLTIRGKSYDPKPYGIYTSIHVWIDNDAGEMVFSEWRNDTEMYYEGEWTTGEKALLGRGGALYYMPEDFEKEIIWASNGMLTGQESVINAVSNGCGFLFFSGHGSPNVWADQYPGIPGNRAYGGVTGLQVTSLKPWPPFFTLPLFPMDTIDNQEKLPIAVVGGCHNSQFNVSMVLGLYDIMPYLSPLFPEMSMWCHGQPVPETFSWRLVRNPNGGAIASMGNTGLGYGMPGVELTTGGGDSWITIEFFRQYGEEGQSVLGNAYRETLISYLNTFDMTDLEAGHPKTIEQWVLLGDPSLHIGGL